MSQVQALTCLPVEGIGEVLPGDDLARLLADCCSLVDGDVVVVTSKVVSKSEGRLADLDRQAAVEQETDRVVAVRGATAIVRTRLGLVMAAAGVDASNVAPGTVVLLPEDPDGSARRLRTRLHELTGRNVAVVVTDTAGRAWRHGQTDMAVGVAGLEPLHDLAGCTDGYGNELAVTAPAVADEIAAAADLVKGKLGRRPAALLRGAAALVLPPGRHGAGATALVREETADLFGLGARDAVLRALAGDPADLRGFGAAASVEDVAATLADVAAPGEVRVEAGSVLVDLEGTDARAAGRAEARVGAAAFALGWLVDGPAPGPGGAAGPLRVFRPHP